MSIKFTSSACLLLAGLGPLHIAAQPSAQLPADDARIRAVVDQNMRPYLSGLQAAGAIVGISVNGKSFFYAYGSARDDGSPFTSATLVEIGSCTKVFTTTLFALAVNRHQIDPNASAQSHMPRGFKLTPPADQITPLQLADFTSGLPDNAENLPRGLAERSIENYTQKDFLHWAAAFQPMSPPPAPYVYSNAGIGLLSYLVADATGRSWEDQLNSEILQPLGMPDTALRLSPSQTSRLATGHHQNGRDAISWPVFAWYAAGGLRSTASDMLHFGEANLGHKLVDGKPVSSQLVAAMKFAQTPIYELPNGDAKQGMAWVTNLGPDGDALYPEILKNGGTVGFGSVILLNPATDTVVFIAVNQNESKPAPIAVKIGRQLAAH